MATNDVPGANPANNDKLAPGCWAEHQDGSLLLVEGIDANDRVIYLVFDMAGKEATEYRDAMPKVGFERQFTWKPGTQDVKWTWHDKTAFPWNRIIAAGVKDGPRHSSFASLVTAAAQAIKSRERVQGRPAPVSQAEIDDLIARIKASRAPRGVAQNMIKKIQGAIRGLKT